MSEAKPFDFGALVVRAANSDWARPALYALATPHFTYFAGPWIALPWLACCLACEAAFVFARTKAAGGDAHWRAPLVGLALFLPLTWVAYATALWLEGSLAAQAAALCALFTTAVVSALRPQADRALFLGGLAPPVLFVFAILALAYVKALPLAILPIGLCSAFGIVVFMYSSAEASYQSHMRLRQMRAELKAERDELDRRVRERTAELELANVAANAASVAKTQFLATMSHELRTPLNAVIGFSEIVIEELDAKGMSQTKEDMKRIRTAGENLLALVNGVLDFAKADANEMILDWDDMDPAALIRAAVEETRPGARARGDRVEVEIGAGVTAMRGDGARFKQALGHLLSNAVKFTKDGVISVTAGAERNGEGDWLIVAVRDSGVGLAAEDRERLFLPFVVGDGSSTRATGGTGLGLAMTRKIALLMGGDVGVFSRLGAGATFTLRLPMRAPNAASVAA